MVLHGFVFHVPSVFTFKLIMTKLFSIYNIQFLNHKNILDKKKMELSKFFSVGYRTF